MFDTHTPPFDDNQNPASNNQDPQDDQDLQDMMQTFTPNQDEEIAALKAQVAQLTDSLARSQAEFINFRKRQALEQESFAKFANQKLILDLGIPRWTSNLAFQDRTDLLCIFRLTKENLTAI